MNSKSILLLSFFGSLSLARAQEDPIPYDFSLMFSESEVLTIEKERQDQTTKANASEEEGIYLGAVMILGPSQWTLWVNGQAVRPDEPLPPLKVQRIQGNEVYFKGSFKGLTHVFALRPHQTYCPQTRQVKPGKGCGKSLNAQEDPLPEDPSPPPASEF